MVCIYGRDFVLPVLRVVIISCVKRSTVSVINRLMNLRLYRRELRSNDLETFFSDKTSLHSAFPKSYLSLFIPFIGLKLKRLHTHHIFISIILPSAYLFIRISLKVLNNFI